ncbi:hypothetical protein HMPREF0970_00528 [Schaalia odontolytica F0309]|uniref:Uncharacterized protein n=1 Tax=Schaalia odontolytica F0309 TaxID=649742 RepID=D4TX71_9ACTO|nr:hypothetical protein HMPREF0970_00528 [Schaalia odontolytica F0309]
MESQCTVWRSVLYDPVAAGAPVAGAPAGLNAPFGARCFMTLAIDSQDPSSIALS